MICERSLFSQNELVPEQVGPMSNHPFLWSVTPLTRVVLKRDVTIAYGWEDIQDTVVAFHLVKPKTVVISYEAAVQVGKAFVPGGDFAS